MRQEKWMRGIHSDGSIQFITNPSPKVGDTVTIKIRSFIETPITKVYISYLKNGEEVIDEITDKEKQDVFIYYRYTITLKEKYLTYHFVILTEEQMYFYNQMGLDTTPPLETYNFKLLCDFKSPTWIKESVFYQIFPERYYNGNKENDVKDGEYEFGGFYTQKKVWEQAPGSYPECGSLDFFGGDLEGIQAKIDYMKDLGVNALYINPIFEAKTNHKYDCLDYFSVDAHFGGNKALEALSEKLHEESMKIILDVSINHTSVEHKWVKEHPEFYHQKEHGELEKWNGVPDLASLNFTSTALKDYIYNNEDSVLLKWLKPPYNIDGWRFDVGQSVAKMNDKSCDEMIWKEIREKIKNLNQDKLIMVEHWDDCIRYLQGDMWDSSMNYYGFARNMRVYLGEHDPFLYWKLKRATVENSAEEFVKRFYNQYAQIPYQISSEMFNFINSHDVSRLHTSPTITLDDEKAAIMMLFTFLGVPSVYYGDEVRIEGYYGSDIGARFPMLWDEQRWNIEIRELYKKLIQYHKQEAVLKTGSFKFIMLNENALCYVRFNDEKAVLLVNSQEKVMKTIVIKLEEIGSYQNAKVIEQIKCTNYKLKNNCLEVDINKQGTIIVELTK